ncbi:PaaI family thioesterase [Pseudomonas sp. NPDC090755]|uniref:PaaI family thioesterase n=1 Tax=Pseudomonas sp. NPDC090755 TaxID=3364481 RepID=UPI00383AD30A
MQGTGFVPSIGAIYVNRQRRSMGARIAHSHLNPLGFAHGGMLATLIDTSFGMAIKLAVHTEVPPVTVCLNIEYLSPAYPGSWIESTVEVQKIGARLTNASCVLRDGERLIAKGNAIFVATAGVPTSKTDNK